MAFLADGTCTKKFVESKEGIMNQFVELSEEYYRCVHHKEKPPCGSVAEVINKWSSSGNCGYEVKLCDGITHCINRKWFTGTPPSEENIAQFLACKDAGKSYGCEIGCPVHALNMYRERKPLVDKLNKLLEEVKLVEAEIEKLSCGSKKNKCCCFRC